MITRLIGAGALVLAACVAAPADAVAQSLAALAEQAASHNGAAVKTYTNADLEDAGTPRDASAVPQPSALPEAGAPAVEEPATRRPIVTVEKPSGESPGNLVIKLEKNSSAENEPFWRRVTKSVKDRIATAEAELAMIAGLLETAGDNDREKLTSLQTKRQRDLEFLNAEYAGHVKRAQALGVPPEWLR